MLRPVIQLVFVYLNSIFYTLALSRVSNYNAFLRTNVEFLDLVLVE